MSWKKYAINCKDDYEDRSRKDCACGERSANDIKKNIHHRSTNVKLMRRIERRFKWKNMGDN